MADQEQRKPWSRLDGEAGEAFAAFCVYLELGPVRRSLRAAYIVWRPTRKLPFDVQSTPLDTAADEKRRDRVEVPSTWKKWTKLWRWQERAEAWDEHQRQIKMASQEEAARAAGRNWVKRQEEQREKQFQVLNSLADGAVRACAQGNLVRNVISTTEPIQGRKDQQGNALPDAVKTSAISHDLEKQIRLQVDLAREVFGEAEGPADGQSIPIVSSYVTWRAKMLKEQDAAPVIEATVAEE